MNTWDDAKRQTNIAKHGVDFTVADDFEWGQAIIEPDARRAYGEAREIAIGPIGERLYIVVFTQRNGRRRIISVRKANVREVRRYETKIHRSDA